MKMTINNFLLAALASLTAGTAAHAAPPLKAELLGPDAPVVIDRARMTALRNAATAAKKLQTLHESGPGNRSREEFLEELRQLETILAQARAERQGVELRLRLTNTVQTPLTLHYGPDTSTNHLHLKGPGALNLPYRGPMTMEFRQPPAITLDPAASRIFPIHELKHGPRDMSRWLLTAPGTYSASLRFVTHLGDRKLDLPTNPVSFEVKYRD